MSAKYSYTPIEAALLGGLLHNSDLLGSLGQFVITLGSVAERLLGLLMLRIVGLGAEFLRPHSPVLWVSIPLNPHRATPYNAGSELSNNRIFGSKVS
ncbi:hypothetical protein [Bradyrhizobium zhanjiangense]|uniref:hypothetical protein n=1 Tax=Bradyrhizobium zhanjiangense TaxID=1325107 RepID=UPI0013E8A79E|nr:hypothetical protein [Bradyrhizobium zhanjiangense]